MAVCRMKMLFCDSVWLSHESWLHPGSPFILSCESQKSLGSRVVVLGMELRTRNRNETAGDLQQVRGTNCRFDR